MAAAGADQMLACLQRGFIDAQAPSQELYLPQLLVNNKAQGKTVLSALHRHLAQCQEFWFSVAFVTKGGVAALLHLLQDLDARQIKGRILVSQYQNFTQPEALRTLLRFTNIELRIATTGNFHAKGYLFRKQAAYDLLVGSSNLTASALSTNKEWNLQVSATAHSELLGNVLETFQAEFDAATPVDEAFVAAYDVIYQAQRQLAARLRASALPASAAVQPNAMQREALQRLAGLRAAQQRKALLISATGTGKTYLSAFDAQAMAAQKMLFVVHRRTIAQAALATFARIFGTSRRLALYSGDQLDAEADFLFCTVQTMSKPNHFEQFARDYFDYIVVDETHRSAADSYQRLLDYFQPRFLLGMTATPERTDGYNIFEHFDHNIAYEIRLQRALEADMLCPFHYYGVTDLTIGGEVMPDAAQFSQLVAEERVDHVLAKAQFYGCDNGRVRGLVFCRTVEESRALSVAFNRRGLRTVVLWGSSSEAERTNAIARLEGDDVAEPLDYIFTVDLFNEGIDIPRLNQIIMLRPTQSAIVFVQQLGRGLRKAEGKEHLTVIDFIGNYQNNYLVPIALFGDTTFNKDTLRKLMTAGSSLLPGTSTISFDRISQERIFASINTANLNRMRDLVQDYTLLKFQLGRMPLMLDFEKHGARDPMLYVAKSGSYFSFAAQQEPALRAALTPAEEELLGLISTHVANAKRIVEVIMLELLLRTGAVSLPTLNAALQADFGIEASQATYDSAIRSLNFDFINNPRPVVTAAADGLAFTPAFAAAVAKPVFRQFLQDALAFAKARYRSYQQQSSFVGGFFLYQKYSRRDVCRILNWDHDESSTMYGYKVKHRSCPIFVNYHKEEDIAESTKYEDGFVTPQVFQWMSRARRTLDSSEVVAIRNYQQENLRLPLFIKKNNDEGTDFYYMGDVMPMHFEQSSMRNNQGQTVPVVQVRFHMHQPVPDSLYHYLTTSLA